MARRQPVAAEPDDRLALTYTRLHDLQKWPSNPKEHDAGAIAASIIRFGMRDPIGFNRSNHFIEEGHGRIDVLAALKGQGRVPPRFVVVNEDDGEWLVPTLAFDDDEATQRGYMLAHNRTQDLGGGYDDSKLLAELENQARFGLLPGTGYDGDDVEALRRRLTATEGSDQSAALHSNFQIVITCASEQQQLELIERFAEEGLECRALVS